MRSWYIPWLLLIFSDSVWSGGDDICAGVSRTDPEAELKQRAFEALLGKAPESAGTPKDSRDGDDISCLNENNEAIDWFLAHKFPKFPKASADVPEVVKRGEGYRYILSTDNSNKWTFPDKSIKSSDTLIANTVAQKDYNTIASILYNDQPPSGHAGETVAHGKGILMVNTSSGAGVWITHSVPGILKLGPFKFPDERLKNGQTFLCLTLNQDGVNQVGRHLYKASVNFYDSRPGEYISQLQALAPALFEGVVVTTRTKDRLPDDRHWRRYDLTTRGNFNVNLFSKRFTEDPNAKIDIWSQVVAPQLNTNMLVQSWLCGVKAVLPRENNGDFYAENIEKLKTPWKVMDTEETEFSKYWYSTTKDHSKWGVSDQESKPYVCVGDLNRVESQKRRGGGVACFSKLSTWRAFNELLDYDYHAQPDAGAPVPECDMETGDPVATSSTADTDTCPVPMDTSKTELK